MPWVVYDKSNKKISIVYGNGEAEKYKAQEACHAWEEYCWQNGSPKRGDKIK